MVLALVSTRDVVSPGRKRQLKVQRKKCASRSDLDLLNRLKPLSCLSADALDELATGLDSANFQRREVILAGEALASGIHILLKGVAKITCVNRCGQRVTVALLAPGPIPEFPSLVVSRWYFQCEAYSDCRFGNLDWDRFDIITRAVPQSALRRFHENNLMQWYPWSLSFLGLGVRERLVFTLLQLCSSLGVIESRGTLLLVSLSHRDLADLVGASRPRVTEHLAELEREQLLIRQGRQFIVRVDKLANSTGLPPPNADSLFTKADAQAHLPKKGQFYGPRALAVASVRPRSGEPYATPVSRFVKNPMAMA